MKSLFILSVLFALLSCGESSNRITEIGTLGKGEISGLEYSASSGLWGLEDSGNDNKLYKIDEKGKVVDAHDVINARNNDWEDLASDAEGNLYIGDFGNNDNDRRDLAIYKLRAGKFDSIVATTQFYYPQQKAFPPKKSERIYDCEAFVEHNGMFLLFSKNRAKGFDGSFNIYSVPNKPGKFPAKLMATMKTCGNYNKCAVTGADISPDGTTIALISGDKLWLLTGFEGGNFDNATLESVELGHHSQKEGICFKDDDTILIADEEDDGRGGKLYEVKLSALKSKI